jgi:hypothetical protein
MQNDIIRTKRDSQNIGIGAWCAFLVINCFIILHGIFFISGTSASIWQEVLSGDYGQNDLVLAIAISVVVYPLLLAFYSLMIVGPLTGFEQYFTTVEAGDLVLTRRFILGFSRTRRVPIGQIIEVRLDQQEDEDSAPHYALSIKIGNKRQLALTRPETDLTEMETLADRLRTALRSAGWTDASATGLSGDNPESVRSTSHTPRP